MLLNLYDLYKKYNMQISGVIHIGAHFAEESSYYDNLNIKNRVYIEPIKKTFNVLKSRTRKEDLLINCALGNENKKIEMFVEDMDKFGCHSILQPGINYKDVSFSQKETVDMYKLDDINLNFTNYNFLNIDVQGYELEVLKGASKTLNHVDFIICEVNRSTSEKDFEYIGAVDICNVDTFLTDYNFVRVETSWDGISWGDAFYVKR
jgi:FkbM family methyltransferase